uniref:Xylulose kinase-1 n=1 Tax=Tanacetum cinerariifolium TaxID=118510 RepID=A0A6L2LVU5_TANCI|nr:xylulose kinase-1 [Tanacetum cinerariifolium]
MVAILEKGEFNSDFHQMVDFIAASPLRYALTVKPTIFVSYIRQFWSTTRIETTDEGTHILAIVDGIQRTVSESSIRRNLKLRDEDGIVSIPDTELFENLTLMGPKSTGFNEFNNNIATALVCLATNRTYNYSKMIFDDEHASPVRDVSEGEACPTDSGFIADQDRATIAKSSTLPHDSTPRVTSPAADEGSVAAKQSGDDAPIKGRSINEWEAAAEKISNDSEKIARVLTSIDAATILAGGIDVPTGSDFIPTTGPPATVISTGSEVGPAASPIATRRKGNEVMVESDTPKKKRLQEQIDAQVARELEEKQEKEDMRMNEQIARDAEVARIHVEEELQGMIDSLDKSNETIAKYLQEYQDFASELPLEKRIELISDLVKYPDNYSKIIIYHLRRIHNIHQRSASSFHLAEEDFRLGNLKFVPKGKIDEVFGMPIPDKLISNNIKNAPYYNAYLEMVAKHDRKVTAKKEGKKKNASAKQLKSKLVVEKSSKLALASKPEATKERPSKASTAKTPKLKLTKEKSTKTTLPEQADKGKIIKVRKAKSPFQLVDEPNEEPTHSEPLNSNIKVTRRSTTNQFVLQRWTPVIEEASTSPSSQAQDDMFVNIIHDSPSPTNAETDAGVEFKKTNSGGDTKIMQFDKEKGKDMDDQVNLEEKTDELDQGQARSAPELEVVFMVTVPIHQASFLIPPISTLIINLSPPKPASSTKSPIFTATTTNLPPPTQPQSIIESDLAARVTLLEKKLFDLEQTNKTLDNMSQNLGSKVFNLELRDLPHKIDEVVPQVRKWLLQITYEALEASMERAQRDEFLAKNDKSHKRQHDDQDPPLPPPLDSDLSKRRRHDTGASGSSQPQAPQSSAWKKFDTREAPPSNNLILMMKDHTLEPAWVIPSSHIPDAEKNWANALATTYQAPAETYLLEKTGDMRTFMHWHCQQMGKTELTQAYFEGQAYEVVKSYYPNVIHLYKGSGHALSISKIKVACYVDFGLKLVLEHMWINEVYTYDISASYGISHWWFNRQKFYIDRHMADSSRKVVRTHMRILSVVTIKAFSRYRYDYLKEITLRRADYQEYTIAEKDFESLYPTDFEDLNLLLL